MDNSVLMFIRIIPVIVKYGIKIAMRFGGTTWQCDVSDTSKSTPRGGADAYPYHPCYCKIRDELRNTFWRRCKEVQARPFPVPWRWACAFASSPRAPAAPSARTRAVDRSGLTCVEEQRHFDRSFGETCSRRRRRLRWRRRGGAEVEMAAAVETEVEVAALMMITEVEREVVMEAEAAMAAKVEAETAAAQTEVGVGTVEREEVELELATTSELEAAMAEAERASKEERQELQGIKSNIKRK